MTEYEEENKSASGAGLRTDVFLIPPQESHGEVRFGGPSFFSSRPCYPTSYLLASQLLFRSAQEADLVAEAVTPLLFLHRHILELTLKEALEIVIQFCEFNNRIAAKAGEVTIDIPEDARKAATSWHGLDELLMQLETLHELADFGNLAIPESLSTLVKDLSADETGFRQKGTVHRYEQSKNRSGDLIRFADESRSFPIRPRQKLVEKVFMEMRGAPDEDFYSPKSYIVSVALEIHTLDPYDDLEP